MQGSVASAHVAYPGTLLLSSMDGQQGTCLTLHGHKREATSEHLCTIQLLLSGSSPSPVTEAQRGQAICHELPARKWGLNTTFTQLQA